MANDLLVRLLDIWIAKEKMPDELSIEYGRSGEEGDDPIIYFRWFDTNKEREFGYSEARHSEVWDRFNGFWNSSEGVRLSEARVLREKLCH